jgi:hypothetical protein
MTETERRIDAVMIALSALRRSGIIRPDAAVSPATMAYVSEQIGEPVSKATFHRTTRRALTRAHLALTAHASSTSAH